MVLAVSLGCGGPPEMHRSTADAPEVDAIAADAALDAPGAALTTVTVFDDNHAVIVGINVYFQDADSNMIAVVATDAQGKASVVMPPGGHISYFQRDWQGIPSAWTFANILPGEELFFERRNTFRQALDYTGARPVIAEHGVIAPAMGTKRFGDHLARIAA